MDLKRLNEIENRKIEIRKTLESNEKVEFASIKDELEKLNNEEKEIRSKQEILSGINTGLINTKIIGGNDKMENENNEMEYRKAFMSFVQTGTMPEEYRSALTSNNSAVIPQTTLNKIVEKMESYGNILPLVTKVAYPAGLAIPSANLGLVATWTAEGKASDTQGAATTSIVFGAFKLQCRVGISLEMHVKSVTAFENSLVENVSKAMVKAIESAIISGDGASKPTGIITTAGTDVNIATIDYKTLVDVEASIPSAYDASTVYVMSKKTFMAFVGMVDANKQPIARVSVGLASTPERTLLGRTVVLSEYLPSFDAVEAGGVFAFAFDLSQYVLNTGYDISVRNYVDETNDDQIFKATALVDGKVVDATSLVLLKKAK